MQLDDKPDTRDERITLFVGHLIYKGRKASTIKSYISAIKAILWEDGFEVNEDRSQITALTRACRLINNKIRLKLPHSQKIT